MTTRTTKYPDPPCYRITVACDGGDAGGGMHHESLVEVVTAYYDHCTESDWDALSPEDQELWVEVLSDLHGAEVAVAEAPYEIQEHAARRGGEEGSLAWYDGDLDDLAAWLREG